jgi:hypothetical protein
VKWFFNRKKVTLTLTESSFFLSSIIMLRLVLPIDFIGKILDTDGVGVSILLLLLLLILILLLVSLGVIDVY